MGVIILVIILPIVIVLCAHCQHFPKTTTRSPVNVRTVKHNADGTRTVTIVTRTTTRIRK